MYAWQFAKALYTSDLHGWTRFVSMQPHYHLLYSAPIQRTITMDKPARTTMPATSGKIVPL
jgi:aryl-alcohol dehydrogenase-like predicted oxidoreductase